MLELIGLGAALAAVLALLLLDLAGVRRLQPARRWQGWGIALGITGVLISSWLEGRGGYAGWLHDVPIAARVAVLVGVGKGWSCEVVERC